MMELCTVLFPLLAIYSNLIVTRLGLDVVWNTFSNVCHHIHMSNLVWKHLHWSVSSVFRSESRMISNDWYTSFLRSVGILDYDRLASSQKRKCLVILTTILLCPSSHVLCTILCWPKQSQKPSNPRQVKLQDHSSKSKWISTKRPKTERHQLGDWIGPGGWNPDDQILGHIISDMQATQF